jgi:hypothetical protein
MGAPDKGIEAAEQPAAESLLSAFKTIGDPERRRHASLLNYWLSIRGEKEFPPLHDLDPLEISDAGPSSILLELLSGGHDAHIRHIGEALKGEAKVEQIIDAPSPSILACIAKKLPIVAISRDFLAFEDEFEGPQGPTRCWATLLPLSAEGAWVDYVYAMVSVDGPAERAAEAIAEPEEPEAQEPAPEVAEMAEEATETSAEPVAEVPEEPTEISAEPKMTEAPPEERNQPVEVIDTGSEPEVIDEYGDEPPAKPGFAKLFDSLVGLTNFYGSEPIRVEPVLPEEAPVDESTVEDVAPDQALADELPSEQPEMAETPIEEAESTEERLVAEASAEEPEAISELVIEQPAAEQPVAEPAAIEPPATEPAEQPAPALEGTLQSKLAEVRTKADEARQAKLKANAALYEGLSAAYDFALDAEDAPEEYLRLVEAQGLKIQLRSPMKPVVKLAFDGMCDEAMIKQLEAVLAWAFEKELPRGALADRIQSAGGIGPILNGETPAA